MKRFKNVLQWVGRVVGVSLTILAISACEGDRGPAGSSFAVTGASSSSLTITVDSVTVASPPVVKFHVGNQDSNGVKALTTDDLRFTIAKLMPGSLGNASSWQNYVLTTQTASASGAPGVGDTAVQATRENDGTLVDHGDGSYTYTFATDITNVSCPAPCQDSEGNTLDVSYQPSLTHRLAIQTANGLPTANAVYTFRPSDGATEGIFSRNIVSNESCNECHNELSAHDERIDTAYCVTCHNPGTTDPDSGNTVDFKVMIHKIHRGEDLPSGDLYTIWGYRDSKHDFSTVVFPQDIRHCTKCHDGNDAATPDGDNWQTQVTMEACGSCHDDVDFSVSPPTANAHPGGRQTNNEQCVGCHSVDGVEAGSVATSHYLAEPVARQRFKLNILKICGEDVVAEPSVANPGPQCAPGDTPTVTFSITDPTNNDAKYDITTTPEITGSNVSFLVAWDTRDYNNTDGTSAPSSTSSISIAGAVAAVDPRTYTVTAGFTIPNGGGANGYVAEGSGAVGIQGRLVGDFDNDGIYNETSNSLTGERERIFVKSEVAFFRIDDAITQPRRPTVDNDKCNQCHDQVSLHGGSRSGEYGVCVLCHNPNNTDINRRPAPPTLDLKAEESIDLRRLIHGIHAGAQTLFDGSPGHGFREQGLVIYGYGGNLHDFSHVRFPGILNDCETCHVEDAYLLEGRWAAPTLNGLLSSSITTDPDLGDPADDTNISPTAAVCSACHDGDLARAHMVNLGGAVFDQTQSVINASVIETCSVCHGPGRTADVKVVHGVD